MDKITNAIAIDGPVAAGKGTIASIISKKLHGFHLYTGAMYRSLTLYCLEHNIPVTEKEAVINALMNVWFDIEGQTVFLNDKDVTERIKQRDVATATPKVAAIAEVRAEMVKRQQEIGRKKIERGMVVVAEGRDAAIKIFPDAILKIFLTASPEVRAKRRYEQMTGQNYTYEQVLEDTIERDRKDYERTVDPLVKDPVKEGYVVVDNSTMNEEETVEAVLKVWEEKKRESYN